ncbi:MAG: ACT domain-containing protein [Desulfamplus sp.]|nr:ACT domain-containing protein [Desulfamplus sp.]
MEKKFIMTAFGKDRPGIVADVSGIIYENGCNLEESQMGLLADEFTLILLLSGQGEMLEENLYRDCRRLEKEKGISVFIRPLDFHRIDYKANGFRHTVSVEGIDQAGIVYKVSKLFAEHGINIITLNSKTKPSPESGTALYVMNIDVIFPKGLAKNTIERELENIGKKLHVEISLD